MFVITIIALLVTTTAAPVAKTPKQPKHKQASRYIGNYTLEPAVTDCDHSLAVHAVKAGDIQCES